MWFVYILQLKSLNRSLQLGVSKLEQWKSRQQHQNRLASRRTSSLNQRQRRHLQSQMQIKSDDGISVHLSGTLSPVRGQQPSPNVGVTAVSTADEPLHCVSQTAGCKRRRSDCLEQLPHQQSTAATHFVPQIILPSG